MQCCGYVIRLLTQIMQKITNKINIVFISKFVSMIISINEN